MPLIIIGSNVLVMIYDCQGAFCQFITNMLCIFNKYGWSES